MSKSFTSNTDTPAKTESLEDSAVQKNTLDIKRTLPETATGPRGKYDYQMADRSRGR